MIRFGLIRNKTVTENLVEKPELLVGRSSDLFREPKDSRCETVRSLRNICVDTERSHGVIFQQVAICYKPGGRVEASIAPKRGTIVFDMIIELKYNKSRQAISAFFHAKTCISRLINGEPIKGILLHFEKNAPNRIRDVQTLHFEIAFLGFHQVLVSLTWFNLELVIPRSQFHAQQLT